MLFANDPNRNLMYYNENDLLFQFTVVKENYDKYGNLIICLNFVCLSYSVIMFMILTRCLENVQDFCKGHTWTFSLNILSTVTYIVASVMIGIAVKRKSHKYFKKYIILLVGCFIIKTMQFYNYVIYVKSVEDDSSVCKDILLVEEKVSGFLTDLLCYAFLIYICLKLKGFLLRLIDISKRLEEIGYQRNINDSYEDLNII